jgi:cobalamin 5'-phosphate synthase/cobalamin synthase
MNALRRFAVATSYVTRLTLCKLPATDADLQLSGLSKYLPAVGLLIGALLFALACGLNIMNPSPMVWGAVLTIAWLLITGGIHFDGLMDTADGIFSHRNQERMLEIMADSRVGNFGAITGWCVLLLKFAALSSLPFSFNLYLTVFLMVPAWARWCETFAIGAFPYLREQGMGKVWHDTTRFPRDVFLAALAPLVATACLQYQGSTLAVLAALLTVASGLSFSFWLNDTLKGQTGDTYGACVELAETGGLLLLSLCSQHPLLSFLL